MTIRKRRTRAHVIADMSLHHLCYVLAKAGFTAEAIRADYGYDLTVFTFDDDGTYENGNVFVQLKATERVRRDPATGSIGFRVKKRDLLTWEEEPFPVYLVLFDAAKELAYGLYLQRYLQSQGVSAGALAAASLEVVFEPRVLDVMEVRSWRGEKAMILERLGAVRHV